MDNSIMDNLNGILWGAFGVLTALELFIRFALPRFRKDPKNAGWVETFDSLWVAMAVALSLKAVLVQPFTIPSGSMEDTLQISDYILVNKFTYGYSFLNKTPRFLEFNKPKHRDVVVFVYPVDPSKDFIKRCIGVPGDVIELRNADLYVNGEKQVEPYVKHLYSPLMALAEDGPDSKKVNFGPVTVTPNHYFMMGDNRDNSLDSRYWGEVPTENIKGRAWVIYWHSVSMGTFVVLGSLGVIVFCFFGWLGLKYEKNPPTDTALLKAKNDAMRQYGYTAAFCLLVGIFMVAHIGNGEFKDNLQLLKSRMFTVIK
jgi:signal peptidase I